jgi:hypothetical protein
MERFKNYLVEQQQLDEKLILLSNGKKYGQICFLCGGAGSGKGFAAANFMEREKFKVRDVDEWKKTFLKIAKIQSDPEKYAKKYDSKLNFKPGKFEEIHNLDLTKPKDVYTLHLFIDKIGIKDKTLDQMLDKMEKPEILPNIMFDITAKNINDIAKFMPKLLLSGYNPANIHIVWILTNYKIALSNNLDPSRGRIVPEDIMLQTHKGAAQTMYDYIGGYGKKLAINGQIHVVLNNRENTIWYGDSKKVERISSITGAKITTGVIKDFKYLTLKERGKSIKKEKSVQKQLYRWIVDNIPTGDLLKGLVDRGVKQGKQK